MKFKAFAATLAALVIFSVPALFFTKANPDDIVINDVFFDESASGGETVENAAFEGANLEGADLGETDPDDVIEENCFWFFLPPAPNPPTAPPIICPTLPPCTTYPRNTPYYPTITVRTPNIPTQPTPTPTQPTTAPPPTASSACPWASVTEPNCFDPPTATDDGFFPPTQSADNNQPQPTPSTDNNQPQPTPPTDNNQPQPTPPTDNKPAPTKPPGGLNGLQNDEYFGAPTFSKSLSIRDAITNVQTRNFLTGF
jgi:hypothetical protein